MSVLILAGPPGVGKTTVGELLAASLGPLERYAIEVASMGPEAVADELERRLQAGTLAV